MTNTLSMRDYGHDVYQIDAAYVSEGIAGIYLVKQNDRIAIIETGTPHSVPNVLNALKQLGLGPESVDLIIPTHIHLDHAAGAGALMALCINATLIVHPRGVRHMVDPSKLEAGTRAVYGDEAYERFYGKLTPVDASRIVAADDGHSIDFQGRTLTFLDTPGHALHHFCIHDDLSGGVFTGDTVGLAYPAVSENSPQVLFATTTPVHFDPEAMKTSIARVMSLNPPLLFLTHYGAIEPSDKHMRQLDQSLNAFVDIARTATGEGKERVAAIRTEICNWLVDAHVEAGSRLTREELERWFRTDADLNAQGLEVWLKRMS